MQSITCPWRNAHAMQWWGSTRGGLPEGMVAARAPGGGQQNWVTGASFTLRGHSWDLLTVRLSCFRRISCLFRKPFLACSPRISLLDSCSSSSSTASSTRLLFSKLNECTQTIRRAVERRAIFFVLSHRMYQINCDEPVSLQVFLIFFATTFHSFVLGLSRNSYNYVSRWLFAIVAWVSK